MYGSDTFLSGNGLLLEGEGRTGVSDPRNLHYLMVSVLLSYFTVPVFWFI